jgi:hypothetical protein
MSCVIDGIIEALKVDYTQKGFLKYVKSKNCKTINVLWNDEELSDKQLDENYEHIKNLTMDDITNGYFCSICDPLLILVAQIYKISIEHEYMGEIINYDYNGGGNNDKIFVASNSCHFWCDVKKYKKYKKSQKNIKK